jgi:CRISPR-associated protein Csb2
MSRFAGWCRKQSPDEVIAFRRHDRTDDFSSPILAGKTLAGEILTSHHHAHYLPTAEGDDLRRVTHLTVYAPGGLGPGERAALTTLRTIRVGDGEPLRAQLVGLGRPEDFTAWLFRSSAVWESVTPFIAHRHPKRRGSKRDTPHLTGSDPKEAFVELALRELVTKELIDRRGFSRLTAVERLPAARGGIRSAEFRRSRERQGDEGWRRPHGLFMLRFESPVPGPVSLGYASHYGLGLFQPG